jgi:hypothetical protein
LVAVNAVSFLNLALFVYSLTNSPVGIPTESIQNLIRPYQQKKKYPDHIPPIAMPGGHWSKEERDARRRELEKLIKELERLLEDRKRPCGP